MALGVDTFRKAWWPIAMDSMHSSDGPATFRLIGRLYMGLGIAVVVVLTLISPLLVQWFTGDGYHEAWPIVGILAWQSLFYGFFLIASAGIWKVEKTYINLYLMVGASLFGLLLNWILVPEYAGIGAAIATAITYLLWITASMIVSESLWRVSFSWPVMGFQIIIGGIFVIWYLSNGADYHLHIKIGVGLFFVFLLVLTAVERSTVMMFIRSFKAN
jgi:O-antigen/teichoic acid export membrane protein